MPCASSRARSASSSAAAGSTRSPTRAAVGRLVRDVVADYSERSLNCGAAADRRPAGGGRDVLDRVAGFGPLQRYLDDPEIEEIWVNEPGRVFVARRGRSELTTTILAPGELADLVERMLRTSGRRIDMSTPFVDAMLPDGSRLHVVIPDITRRHMAVNIRKFVLQAHQLDELVALGTLTAQAARFLEAAVAAGLNILVSGGTQAGKTTLLNCLCAAIPARERVVTCEEVFELRVPLPDVVSHADAASRTSRAPARSRCAGWSRRRCGCGPRGSSSARCARRSASTCSSRSTPGCPACAPCTPTAPARPSSRCARCRCWPARTSGRRSSSRPWRRSVDLVVHVGTDA